MTILKSIYKTTSKLKTPIKDAFNRIVNSGTYEPLTKTELLRKRQEVVGNDDSKCD